MTPNVFLRRVVLSNYRSIGNADVRLGPLTYLVGRNGAGKSNFLDALRLVSESLNGSLEQALRERGGSMKSGDDRADTRRISEFASR